MLDYVIAITASSYDIYVLHKTETLQSLQSVRYLIQADTLINIFLDKLRALKNPLLPVTDLTWKAKRHVVRVDPAAMHFAMITHHDYTILSDPFEDRLKEPPFREISISPYAKTFAYHRSLKAARPQPKIVNPFSLPGAPAVPIAEQRKLFPQCFPARRNKLIDERKAPRMDWIAWLKHGKDLRSHFRDPLYTLECIEVSNIVHSLGQACAFEKLPFYDELKVSLETEFPGTEPSEGLLLIDEGLDLTRVEHLVPEYNIFYPVEWVRFLVRVFSQIQLRACELPPDNASRCFSVPSDLVTYDFIRKLAELAMVTRVNGRNIDRTQSWKKRCITRSKYKLDAISEE